VCSVLVANQRRSRI